MKKIKEFFKTKKKIVVLIIVLLVIICVIAGTLLRKGQGAAVGSEMLGTAEAIKLAKQDLSESIKVTGSVESQHVMAVTAEISKASIKQLNVSLGDRVEEGQVLCTFEAKDIENQIDSIKKQESQTARLRQYETEARQRSLAQEQTNYNNEVAAADSLVKAAAQKLTEAEAALKALTDDAASTLESIEKATAVRDAAKASLDEANRNYSKLTSAPSAGVLSAQEAIERSKYEVVDNAEMKKTLNDLQSQLNKTTIVAKQAGIITQMNVKNGSEATGTLMQIEDDKNLRIKVPIKEKQILKLKEGMRAVITADSLPDKEFGGVVSQVINFASSGSGAVPSPESTTTQSSSSSSGGYSAYIDVDPGSELLLGMSVKVEIAAEKSEKKLAVPYDSIVEEDGKKFVYKAVKQGEDEYSIEKVDVETGERNDYYTEITSKGLSVGDLIITTPDLVVPDSVVPVNVITDMEIKVKTESDSTKSTSGEGDING